MFESNNPEHLVEPAEDPDCSAFADFVFLASSVTFAVLGLLALGSLWL